MKKHYVTFYSPGTFFAEDSTREIKSWDVALAQEMAAGIVERYNATPYGFRFTTKERSRSDWEPKETKRSGMYYLDGVVETLEQVEARNDPKENILLANMRGNGYARIVRNKPDCKGWAWCQPLNEDDIVLGAS